MEDETQSKRDETHRKRRATVRTWIEREGGEKTSSDVERLEKEILDLREQLSQIAENVVAKDQQRNGLKLMMRELGGQLWRHGC